MMIAADEEASRAIRRGQRRGTGGARRGARATSAPTTSSGRVASSSSGAGDIAPGERATRRCRTARARAPARPRRRRRPASRQRVVGAILRARHHAVTGRRGERWPTRRRARWRRRRKPRPAAVRGDRSTAVTDDDGGRPHGPARRSPRPGRTSHGTTRRAARRRSAGPTTGAPSELPGGDVADRRARSRRTGSTTATATAPPAITRQRPEAAVPGAAISRVAPATRVDEADDEPGDDPPVLPVGSAPSLATRSPMTTRHGADDGDRRGDAHARPRSVVADAAPGREPLRSSASSEPRVRRLASRADGTRSRVRPGRGRDDGRTPT